MMKFFSLLLVTLLPNHNISFLFRVLPPRHSYTNYKTYTYASKDDNVRTLSQENSISPVTPVKSNLQSIVNQPAETIRLYNITNVKEIIPMFRNIISSNNSRLIASTRKL